MEKIQKIPKKGTIYNYNTITSNTGGIQRKDEENTHENNRYSDWITHITG